VEPGKTALAALPQWLEARSGNRLFLARHGKAYASWGAGGICSGDLELLSATGRSCGCLMIPVLGNYDLRRHASVGRDGSFILPFAESPRVCKYALYPQLLQ
jgi:hypothetical protein